VAAVSQPSINNMAFTSMRLAILDDYQGYSASVDWSRASGVHVVTFRDHVSDCAALVDRLVDFDAVMRIRERTALPRNVLEALPRLKLILATGMRNARTLDLAAADELGIVVSTTDAHHQSTVDVVWALILNLFRNIGLETARVRAGAWQGGLGQGLAGRTLGVVGLGNMGIPVARIGQSFGMRTIAWSPNLTQARCAPHGVACVSKTDLFATADVISLHMPLADNTVGIVGAEDLARMKPEAFFVNTARSELVDEDALIHALELGRIAGAGLDAFADEPLPDRHPYRWLPNVLATPHIGFATKENYALFFQQSLENLLAFIRGEPINLITADRPFLADSQVAKQRGLRPGTHQSAGRE